MAGHSAGQSSEEPLYILQHENESKFEKPMNRKNTYVGTRVHDDESSYADHGYVLSCTFNFYLTLYEVLCNINECIQ